MDVPQELFYRNHRSTFKDFLKQNWSLSMHQKSFKYFLPRFLRQNGLNPEIKEIFKFKAESLDKSNVNAVKYGTETVSSLGGRIWKM